MMRLAAARSSILLGLLSIIKLVSNTISVQIALLDNLSFDLTQIP